MVTRNGAYDIATTEGITVSHIDEYIVCWTGEGTEGKAIGIVTKFKTTGERER